MKTEPHIDDDDDELADDSIPDGPGEEERDL